MLQVGELVHRMPAVADEQRPRVHLLADPVMKQNDQIELAPLNVLRRAKHLIRVLPVD